MYNQITLIDNEWHLGEVTLWWLDDITGKTIVPNGTKATVIGLGVISDRNLLVQIGNDVFEVWEGNVLKASNVSLN